MSKLSIAVILWNDRQASDLSFSLQSLESDGIAKEAICVIGKGVMEAAGVEGYRVENVDLSKDLFDTLIRFSTESGSSFMGFLVAGDLWLKGKADMLGDAFRKSNFSVLAHQFYTGEYGGFKRKLWISKKACFDANDCPLSTVAVRNDFLQEVFGNLEKLSKSLSIEKIQDVYFSDGIYAVLAENNSRRFKSRLQRRLKQQKPSLNSLSDFRNQYEGKRCFVIGNGPSLNQMDLGLLEDEITFVSNAFHLMFDRIQWRPSVYSCIDSVVLPDSADDFCRLISELPETSFFFPDWLGDDDLNDVKWDSSSFLSQSSNVCYFEEKSPISLEQPCSNSLAKHLCRVPTVTGALLQLAILMGCSPIYIIGCDTAYTVPEVARRLKPARIGGTERVILDDDSDPNHFSASYFGKGKVWHEPQAEKMIDFYERFRAQVDPNGKRVFNATVGGALEAFPRVDFNTLF
ncbi:hypothetical protein [Rubellicoccus peritrichatus]|uniref:DUF115 domain-containing protein n=1 Tax=Rubellicoccus peritrichatus TaxID=3080537 RepID=A0AAQ3L8U1_9BACT|nr:hypothetical protein [Puniceicoccus sp. CR14]WOO40961.1 hypothetical protein RZN69_20260 [Puniceicoccus sp. CR14]